MRTAYPRGGALAADYAAVDWSATPLGPVSGWSPTLWTTAELAWNTRFAVTLFWGPEFVMVYNDAYAPLIGDKHPAALGRPAAEVFPEIWDEIGPLLDSVRETGTATWSEEASLLLHRHGFAEETSFTFSYSPVTGPDGGYEGVLDIATETTRMTLDRRRFAALGRLTTALADGPERAEDVLTVAVDQLGSARPDIVSAWVAPTDVSRPGSAPAATAPEVEERDGARFARLPMSAAAEPAGRPALLLQLSDHLPVDAAYLEFLRLVGVTVARALDRVEVREVERRATVAKRAVAEAIQRSLLGEPVWSDRLEIAVRYQPAVEQVSVGGDWYDSFCTPSQTLVLAVGDASGHDRRSAAAMAQLRNVLRGVACTLDKGPAAVMAGVDRALDALDIGALATAVVARIDPADPAGDRTRTLRWTNAGHPPPVLISPTGEASLLTAPPERMLGLPGETARTDHETVLSPGATVLLYTDGLVERRSEDLDHSLAALVSRLGGSHRLGVDEVCDALLAHYGGTADDDIVLLAVRLRDE